MYLTRRGFSLLELMVASSIAFAILWLTYLIYGEALHKGLLINQMTDRSSKAIELVGLITGDLNNSSADSVVFYEGSSEQLLGMASVQNSGSPTWTPQAVREYNQKPLAYEFLTNVLTRAMPLDFNYDSSCPSWSESQLSSVFVAPNNGYSKRNWDFVRGLKATNSNNSVEILLVVSLFRADGLEEEYTFRKTVSFWL